MEDLTSLIGEVEVEVESLGREMEMLVLAIEILEGSIPDKTCDTALLLLEQYKAYVECRQDNLQYAVSGIKKSMISRTNEKNGKYE